MIKHFHIKKGDKVVVTTGQHKGKQGDVLKILREENRALVQGVNMVTRHLKPSAQHPEGIVKKEASIHVSNLAHIDVESGKPSRMGVKILKDGQKVRVLKRSGKQIGN